MLQPIQTRIVRDGIGPSIRGGPIPAAVGIQTQPGFVGKMLEEQAQQPPLQSRLGSCHFPLQRERLHPARFARNLPMLREQGLKRCGHGMAGGEQLGRWRRRAPTLTVGVGITHHTVELCQRGPDCEGEGGGKGRQQHLQRLTGAAYVQRPSAEDVLTTMLAARIERGHLPPSHRSGTRINNPKQPASAPLPTPTGGHKRPTQIKGVGTKRQLQSHAFRSADEQRPRTGVRSPSRR